MRYIDSGGRDPAHALGRWLRESLDRDVVAVRSQSGFFSAQGLGIFEPTLRALAAVDAVANVVIGSNEGATQTRHVAALADLMGIPRPRARLGIVSFAGGFFHPKTYHLQRTDGSQAAYVGSANLGLPGIASTHIEAGITLDSRDGDPAALLDEIAAAVDAWFKGDRPGVDVIDSRAQLLALEDAGVLAAAPPLKPPAEARDPGRGAGRGRPRLGALIPLPKFMRGGDDADDVAPEVGAPEPPAVGGVAVVEPPYPGYVLFAPGRPGPTQGADALSPNRLRAGTVGLLVRLNRDASRHFRGERGTANISLAVSATHTLRFGFYRRRTERPRVEFDLRTRLLANGVDLRADTSRTNVMVYGFSPGDTGHGDVRMVIPVRPVRNLTEQARRRGMAIPDDGDFAAVEWPTLGSPEFRISFLEPGSNIADAAARLFQAESGVGGAVARNAVWLPEDFVGEW